MPYYYVSISDEHRPAGQKFVGAFICFAENTSNLQEVTEIKLIPLLADSHYEFCSVEIPKKNQWKFKEHENKILSLSEIQKFFGPVSTLKHLQENGEIKVLQ